VVSWDADFGGQSWNYTHNTSCMIYAVLTDAGIELAEKEAWWQRLSGMPGPMGAQFLTVIIDGLEGQPERFRAMNPPNGWGSYDGLLATLIEMRDAALTEVPDEWWCSG
jgi:hypothetical protein